MKLALLGSFLLLLASSSRSVYASSSQSYYIDFGGQYGKLTIDSVGDNQVKMCLPVAFKFSSFGWDDVPFGEIITTSIEDANIYCYDDKVKGDKEAGPPKCSFVNAVKCKDKTGPNACKLLAPIPGIPRCKFANVNMDQIKQAIRDATGSKAKDPGFGISINQYTSSDNEKTVWTFHPFWNPITAAKP